MLNPVEGKSDYLLLSFFAAKTFIPFTLKKLQVFCLYCFLRKLMSFTQITKHFIAYYVLTYEYMPFRMGRPKTTGCSHNKEASTYTRKQPLSKTKSKQLTLPAFLNKRKQQNNEEATTSTIVRENIEREQSEIDNKSSEKTASDICVTSNSSVTKQPLKPLLHIAVTLLPMKYKLNGSNNMTSLYIQLQTKAGFVQYAKITAQVNTGAQKQ